MRNISFLQTLCVLFFFFSIGCIKNNVALTANYEIPSRNHDLSYIPFDAKIDNPNYIICDSTEISSGRNGIKYIGGTSKFKKDISSQYLYRQEYESFTGYVVIRFLVNCEGNSGRYRAQSLGLDFTPLQAPATLIEHSIELVKHLDNWTKYAGPDSKREYSKYINLKINNGKIEHVLL